MRRGDLLDQRGHGFGVADVGRTDFTRSASGVDLLADLFKGLNGAADEDDDFAVGGEPLGDGLANAATGSGDDGDALFDWEAPGEGRGQSSANWPAQSALRKEEPA